MHLHLDFETRSAVDLRKVGLWNYARHPSTDVWCMAYVWDGDPELWAPGLKAHSRDFLEHVAAGRPVCAHNMAFELEIWNQIMVPRYGWPELKPEQTYCTLAMAYSMALPGALEDAAKAAGLDIGKDMEGRALMLKYARPWKEEPKLRWMDECPRFRLGGRDWTGAEGLAKLYEYCRQDVRVERALAARLRPLSAQERKVWLMDYAINQRGVRADLETAAAGVAAAAKVSERCNTELGRVTGGEAQSTTALIPLRAWINRRGVPCSTLDKEGVISLLDGELPDDVRRALILRQESSLASTAKLDRILKLAGEDGRLRNMLAYHGANTGRWAARGVQLHNLPRDVPEPAAMERILALVRAGKLDAIDTIYGPPMAVLSQCLRGMFVPAPGHVLIGGDFSNVEGRGVAWFSGEEWKTAAYRAADAGTGPGLYELAYSKSFGVPVEQITKQQRQVGKVQELAFGYGGGVGAARRMAGRKVAHLPDSELDSWKRGWRGAHKNVVRTWYALEDAAKAAVRVPGSVHAAGYPGREVRFRVSGSFLFCQLQSGRLLSYPYPKLLEGKFGEELTYMTVPSPDDHNAGRIIFDPENSNNWARVGTYGGSLMENIVQAFCRDLLVHCMLQLHKLGARIVLHVHDEIVIEVAREKAEKARALMERIMCSPPAWAAGFPLKAAVHVMRRYGKD